MEAIYHEGERLYSEHSTAAEAALLLTCSPACIRAIRLYSGSCDGCHMGVCSSELRKTWNADAASLLCACTSH